MVFLVVVGKGGVHARIFLINECMNTYINQGCLKVKESPVDYSPYSDLLAFEFLRLCIWPLNFNC